MEWDVNEIYKGVLLYTLKKKLSGEGRRQHCRSRKGHTVASRVVMLSLFRGVVRNLHVYCNVLW
jgi:hypothetical protein